MNSDSVLLNSTHKKEQFNCGKPTLDNYIRVQASQDIKQKLAACFVLADDHNNVKGYFTLSASSIPRELLPDHIRNKLPAYRNMPVTLLGRLAIDNNHKRQRLGEYILIDALKKNLISSASIGSIAVVVDPIDDDASNFYKLFGFMPLAESRKMFLPMLTLSKLLRTLFKGTTNTPPNDKTPGR